MTNHQPGYRLYRGVEALRRAHAAIDGLTAAGRFDDPLLHAQIERARHALDVISQALPQERRS